MTTLTLQDLVQDSKEVDLFERWFEARDGLVNRAWAASRRAISYRDFDVGCAVLACRTGGRCDEQFRVFIGANVKVAQEARPICAEMVAILSALHAGYDHIVGVVVVGPAQEDHESGLKPKTLHICGECRKVMKQLSIVKPATRILCVRVDSKFDPENPDETADVPDEFLEEEMSFQDLLDLHNGNGNGHGK